MSMNRWRIGSVSMGIILVALGVMMLVSLVVQINILNTIMTLWPVIMICLGIEILLYVFINKDGDSKIRYDVLSIIFISFILIISTFFYTVTFFAGTFDSRDDMYSAFGVYNDNVYTESSVELAGANELVVFNGINSLKVISTDGANIRVDYNISIAVNSSDKEYAESITDNLVKFEDGERAYMLPNTNMHYNNRRTGYQSVNCVIYLPQGKTLDLSQFYGYFEYDSAIEDQIIRQQY